MTPYDRIPQGIAPYAYGAWDRAWGNHRAVIRVTEGGEVAYAYLPWRRRDAFPQTKHVWIVDAQTEQVVTNSVVVTCNREYGEVVFEPVSGPGLYYAYYLAPTQDPQRWAWPRWAFPIRLYEGAHTTADPGWRERHHVRREEIGSPPNPQGAWQPVEPYHAPWRDLPEAELVAFESRGAWHTFYPMEVIATLEETLDLITRCGERPFLLFPESRYCPIRMTGDLPYHWAARDVAALDVFDETVQRNEYLVFQLGLYAHQGLLANVTATWSALEGPAGAEIPASAITCFNLAGRDQRGRDFVKTLHVPPRTVQALWFGVDIPPDAVPGHYEGVVTVTAQDVAPQTVHLSVEVAETLLADRGDGDHARLSRLRWLNSAHAVDDEVCAPFTPVQVRGREVEILGRTLVFTEGGLPARLTSFIDMFSLRDRGREILAAPVRLDVVKAGDALAWTTVEAARGHQASSGRATFRARQSAPGITRETGVTVEMDGRIGVRVVLTADEAMALDTLRLVMMLPAAVSQYWLAPEPASEVSGEPARLGYACPASMDHTLANVTSAWVGDYNAGLAFNLDDLPAGEDGRFQQRRTGEICEIIIDTGPLAMQAGRPVVLEFDLYVTPFKPLPTDHWDWRYCHEGYGADIDLDRGLAAGAKVFTQHQGSPNNPYISYLFPVAEGLKELADRVHEAGGRFKAYNTIRELSTRASELWTLRSLGEEILPPSTGRLGYESLAQRPLEYQLRNLVNEPFVGQLWMCEHLVDDYHARWHSPIRSPDGTLIADDSSLQISGASRWSNFYIEGLRWLMEHAGVDGLYLDGVTFDRDAFIRVRKTLVRQKPEALIDLHGSPASVMDYLGFVDSIWFGEGADYSREPAYWMTAVSGIPFGVPGELLLTEASVHRGMLYGLSHRYAWMPLERVDPSALWAWWDSFAIQDATMLGYWMDDCPVRTDHPDVKATAYVHPGRRMAIVVASWAPEAVTVTLEIDWEAVGLDPESVRVTAPEIAMFQPALPSASLDALPVARERGWLIVVER